QDLDNFAFARDVVIVVAAGNSRAGVIPSPPYPRHFTDAQWALGTWPRSFNSLTCGSFVEWPRDGVAMDVGAPSPFTKVGWGLCDSPKPDLSENGGNGDEAYQFKPGLGVWGTSAAGNWEDHSGTSFAAPLLARQAAFALQRLESYCDPGTKVFAATVKAYLALSAVEPVLRPALRPLAERTLGRGRASADWLSSARIDRAMIVWQGVLDGPKDLIRVRIPIPKQWLDSAESPRLRIILAWDSPVNAAVEDLWASRKVNATLRTEPEGHALHPSGSSHKTYPLIERKYDLKKLPNGVQAPKDELWLLELTYQQAAEYHPAIDFNPQQRVAFAAELYDESEQPSSPQAALQTLPATANMTRFAIGATVVRNPVVLRNRR
ncbi:MAG: S8 family serine peptidase, partial [Opitutaceae bacterium]